MLVGVSCALALLVCSVDGRVSRTCKVSYETRDGWSEEYKREVEFLTGEELNKATRSFKYDMLSHYALVWFAKDEVAILKLEELLYVRGEFKNEDFKKLFALQDSTKCSQVNSEEKRVWRIKAKDFLSFIDPRAER